MRIITRASLAIFAVAAAAACASYPAPPPPPPPPPPPVVASMPNGMAAPQVLSRMPNTEDYGVINENEFMDAARNPLSTFAIDVDAASYSNVRRFLRQGELPPRDAVRIEELVNYFDYDYPQPAGNDPFSVTVEVGAAPWAPAHRLVHVGLQGRSMDPRELPPSNLVFLVDVSGSMQSPDKLPLLQRSLGLLANRLRPQDRVAIVAYAGEAGLVLPPTDGSDPGAIREAIYTLRPGGSTNGAEGIRLAYALARRSFITGGNNRVILATDGDFNVGVSSESELVQLIEHERQSGVYLTVLGFGTGNLKDSKMEMLADRGNGNYAYIDGLSEARKVLVHEMGGTLVTIARDVKVQVEFNPALVKSYRLIGYENRLLAAEDFNDDRKDAGELGAGHSVTALYEVVPAGADEQPARGVDPLRYQQPGGPSAAAASGELLTVKLRYKPPQGDESLLITRPVRDVANAAPSADFRFSAAVAAWGMLLRDSPHRGAATWDGVQNLAEGALGDDGHGYRHEFVRLVADSRRLADDGRDRTGRRDAGGRR